MQVYLPPLLTGNTLLGGLKAAAGLSYHPLFSGVSSQFPEKANPLLTYEAQNIRD
jgi:hypothetical protein